MAAPAQRTEQGQASGSPQQRKSSPPASSANPGKGAPQNQTPGHPSFRRQRASRACETCHARKVRCDAASLGVPCTNCVAFSIECKIPAPKRKKTQFSKNEADGDDDKTSPDDGLIDSSSTLGSPTGEGPLDRTTPYNSQHAMLDIKRADAFSSQQESHNGTYAPYMRPKFVRAPIKEAGRVAYLGESSNLSLLVHDKHGTTDVVHYPLPENIRGAKNKLNELDNVEIDILHTRGAFLLPPRGLCDELVEAFFTWVAPVVPVINRSRFMRRYRDSKNPPSLLLLQAILLAGSRVCKNPQLMDSNGSTTPAAMTFYKRAKALFDANYEDDRVTIVQAAILMGWYWEGPEDVTRNVFFWSRVATIVAQGSGMHRSVESSQLSKADKRLWKRIWWTLFTRDRSVAVALGRPCGINIEDSDVEMLTEDDFVDDEVDKPGEFPPDQIHVDFFLNYVKLTELMGLVLSQQYSVACKTRANHALDLTHSDMALADWLQNCPKTVFWDPKSHHFWSALLHANYYTTLCLLHRAHMPPAGTPNTTVQNGLVVENSYPSRNIAYNAASMITQIIESLQAHDQLRFTPAFIVYSLFSALIMHVYQMRSSNAAIVSATEQRIRTCMNALKDVSKVWLVAKMVHTLFESILGNKTLEERLQKAAGRKHVRTKPTGGKGSQSSNSQPSKPQQSQQQQHQQQQVQPPDSANKRKFEEVDVGYANGAPSAQTSYERSRPQTPSLTSSHEAKQAIPTMAPPQQTASPNIPRNDAFMGNSRNVTRQNTPFNPSQSYPGTPPDLYLVTRNSPTISSDVWNNFQPDHLFPAETNLNLPNMSPSQAPNSFIDPQLATNPSPNAAAPAPSNPMTSVSGQTQPGQQAAYPPMTHRNLAPQQQPQPNGLSPTRQQQGVHQTPYDPMRHGMQQQHHSGPQNWAQLSAMNQAQAQGHGHGAPMRSMSDETWSNSTVSQGPTVPTALNVEDWFQFFGIGGDLSNHVQAFSS